MNSRNFRIVITILFFSIEQNLLAISPNKMVDLVEIANKIVFDANRDGLGKSVEIRNSVFKALDDREVTQAFAFWMFEKTDNRLGPSHQIFRIMRMDPKIKVDANELRYLLSTENDPRRFYCLSDLALNETRENGEDFIPQKFRMLFSKGLIGEGLDKIEMPYSPEISGVTYTFILWDLKNLGRPFDEKQMLPREGNIPDEQKIHFLAKWLKANWPGCADLEIPGDALKPKEATRPDLRSAGRDNSEEAQERSLDAPDAKMRWPWIVGAIGLLAVFSALLKFRKN